MSLSSPSSLSRRAVEDVRERTVDPGAVVVSALSAGAVFLVVAMVGHAVLPRTSAWDTPLWIASLLVGTDIERSASTGQPGLIVVAGLVHTMLSLTYAMIIDLATLRMPRRVALIGGAVFGVTLYLVNYHVIAPLLPAFHHATGPVTLAAHVAFGLTAVAVFGWMRSRRFRAAISKASA